MPRLSDSLAKVSEEMARLSRRAKAAEEKSAEARAETREQIEDGISAFKVDAQRRRTEYEAQAQEAGDDLAAWWTRFSATVEERVQKMRDQLDEPRDHHEDEVAEQGKAGEAPTAEPRL